MEESLVFSSVILPIDNTFSEKNKTVKPKTFASSSSALAVAKVPQSFTQHCYSPKRQDAGIFLKKSTKPRSNTLSTTSDSYSFQIWTQASFMLFFKYLKIRNLYFNCFFWRKSAASLFELLKPGLFWQTNPQETTFPIFLCYNSAFYFATIRLYFIVPIMLY